MAGGRRWRGDPGSQREQVGFLWVGRGPCCIDPNSLGAVIALITDCRRLALRIPIRQTAGAAQLRQTPKADTATASLDVVSFDVTPAKFVEVEKLIDAGRQIYMPSQPTTASSRRPTKSHPACVSNLAPPVPNLATSPRARHGLCFRASVMTSPMMPKILTPSPGLDRRQRSFSIVNRERSRRMPRPLVPCPP